MELFFQHNPGARLSALLEAQKSLAALYEPWVQGEKIDRDRLRTLHETATVAAHRYYVESIPIYRKLAEELGLVECADSETIRAELASTDHLFKSYPQEWIDARDFESMTEWVRADHIKSVRDPGSRASRPSSSGSPRCTRRAGSCAFLRALRGICHSFRATGSPIAL